MKQKFATEAALVTAFCDAIEQTNRAFQHAPERGESWTIYPETAGYDLLLVHDATGVQIGVEAKLSLNLKVINQVLPSRHDVGWTRPSYGPDYRAVLVPTGGTERGLGHICELLGVTVLTIYNSRPDPYEGEPGFGTPDFKPWPGYKPRLPSWTITPHLPNETTDTTLYGDHWHPWCPEERCKLPEYIPDVPAGVASPVILSDWKIRAIKLLIVLDRRGYVTRADMRFLKLSPTIWTQAGGYLTTGAERGKYIRRPRTPDFQKQHPRVWTEIEADIEKWADGLDLSPS